MAADSTSAAPATASVLPNLPAIASAPDTLEEATAVASAPPSDAAPEQHAPEENLPATLPQLGANVLPPAVLSGDDLGKIADQLAAVIPNTKAGNVPPTISREPRTQRSDDSKSGDGKSGAAPENAQDNATAIAFPAMAVIAQTMVTADVTPAVTETPPIALPQAFGKAAPFNQIPQTPAPLAGANTPDPQMRPPAPFAGARTAESQTPATSTAQVPVAPDSTTKPQNTTTPVDTATDRLAALLGKTPNAADIGTTSQLVAVAAGQKPAAPAPSADSRSKTDTEKKPAPSVAAASAGQAQEPTAPALTTAQPLAENEKDTRPDRSTKSNPSDSAPRTFTTALAAQSENSLPPPGVVLQTSASSHGVPADLGAVTTGLPAGAAQDAATPLRLSMNAAGIAPDAANWDGLALKIAAKSADGESNFQIRLDPPSLGRIDIHLNMDSEGNAQAQLSADRPQTLEFLQRDAGALERALKDAGVDLAGGLSFSLKGEGKSGAWRDAQNSSRSRALQIAGVDAVNTVGAAAMIGSGGQSWGSASARLDIRV
jgi:flagellar hook-length control protein FliK